MPPKVWPVITLGVARCLLMLFNFIDLSENGTDPIHQTLMWEQMAKILASKAGFQPTPYS